jgi:hypothetical protein
MYITRGQRLGDSHIAPSGGSAMAIDCVNPCAGIGSVLSTPLVPAPDPP